MQNPQPEAEQHFKTALERAEAAITDGRAAKWHEPTIEKCLLDLDNFPLHFNVWHWTQADKRRVIAVFEQLSAIAAGHKWFEVALYDGGVPWHILFENQAEHSGTLLRELKQRAEYAIQLAKTGNISYFYELTEDIEELRQNGVLLDGTVSPALLQMAEIWIQEEGDEGFTTDNLAPSVREMCYLATRDAVESYGIGPLYLYHTAAVSGGQGDAANTAREKMAAMDIANPFISAMRYVFIADSQKDPTAKLPLVEKAWDVIWACGDSWTIRDQILLEDLFDQALLADSERHRQMVQDLADRGIYYLQSDKSVRGLVLCFWAHSFHGRILYSDEKVEQWQKDDERILMPILNAWQELHPWLKLYARLGNEKVNNLASDVSLTGKIFRGLISRTQEIENIAKSVDILDLSHLRMRDGKELRRQISVILLYGRALAENYFGLFADVPKPDMERWAARLTKLCESAMQSRDPFVSSLTSVIINDEYHRMNGSDYKQIPVIADAIRRIYDMGRLR